MLNRYDESRKKRWLSRNSIQNNEEYIERLLRDNGFKVYHFMADGYGDSSLEITQGFEEIKIEIDKDEGLYKILKRNMALNPKKKERYRFVKKFKCDDILELLQYVKRKDAINIKNVSNN